jgi:hypothetical protein
MEKGLTLGSECSPDALGQTTVMRFRLSITCPWLSVLLTSGIRSNRMTSSSVINSGQGMSPPLPSGGTRGTMTNLQSSYACGIAVIVYLYIAWAT